MIRLLVASATVWVGFVLSASPTAQTDPHGTPRSSTATSLFALSEDCVACHNGLRTTDGENVSIGTMWRSTMMANSGRDPYFLAGLRRETMDHPSLSAEIQDECAGCHMPMLQRTAHAAGRTADIFAQLPIRSGDAGFEHRLAADSVSCSVCHQIAKDRLGTADSFNGRFSLAAPGPVPRSIFGPFAVSAGRTRIMRSVTGFAQTEAMHIRDSALCATCHTLYTQARGANGEIVGVLPEQMNFQEWQHSAFAAEQRSCQSCHMPDVEGPTRIASVLGEQREGLSRHLLVGGNFFVLRMLDRYRDQLGVEALPGEFATTIGATIRQLEVETASLAMGIERRPDGLAIDVGITTLAGHKFPTGYPSRRAWIHLVARDAAGLVTFESGSVGADGAIAGNDNDVDANVFEPHYDEIRTPDQVQIYETILAAPDNVPTTGLLRATRYLKDNRLLPRGFNKATAHPDIAVHGEARSDLNFDDGGDRVRYVVPLSTATVEVALRYQPIAFRWAKNLEAYDAPEPRRLAGYFNEMAAESSAIVARVGGRVP